MLKDTLGSRQANRTIIRKLSHQPDNWQISMFCIGCPDLDRCGGIAAQAGGHCYMHCCGGKAECQTVCRKNPAFKAQFREIGGFDLENTPRVAPVPHPALHGTAPLILHGKRRSTLVRAAMFTLKLRDVVDMKTGVLRYSTREELADGLKIDPAAQIIVTGIEQDRWVEPWWSLGRAHRRLLLTEFSGLGIALVTPPNFSLFCDQPRPSDFSAMKRIAMVQSEFLAAGIPCAIHPHFRTETDSARWISFVAERPEIQTIAYEFTTGAGRTYARQLHIDHLARLAESAGRPLDLVIRGDQRIIPVLTRYYRNIVYIDTNAFMKSIYRKMAIRTDDRFLDWQSVETPANISLEALMQHNVDEVTLATRLFLANAA